MNEKTPQTIEKATSGKVPSPSRESIELKEIKPASQGEKDFWIWLKDAELYSSKLELR